MKHLALLAVLIITPACVAKDKYNPKNFPITVSVLASHSETTETGITVTPKNSMCVNPQDEFTKGFCSTSSMGKEHVQITSKQTALISMDMGKFSYILAGTMLLLPHEYRARFAKNGFIEILCKVGDGKPHIAKYRIVSVSSKTTG